MSAEALAAVHERAESGDEILRVENLVKYFPIRAGLFKRTVGHIHAVDGVDLSDPRRGDARARRRVRLRQDDPLAHADQADGAHVGQDRLQRP